MTHWVLHTPALVVICVMADQGMMSPITRLTVSDREYEGKVDSLNESHKEAFKLLVLHKGEGSSCTESQVCKRS